LVEQVRQKVEMRQRFDATAATICALAAASISVAASAKGGIGSQRSRSPAIAMFGPQCATDGNTNGYRWPNTRTLPLPLSCATLLEQTTLHRR
jgi:hypothetical protein